MIVVDTSALAAILFAEGEAHRFAAIIAEQDVVIGAPTRFEFLMVAIGRLGQDGLESARQALSAGGLRTISWDEDLADIAANAFRRFGKGLHPAALNFGDCMAYAVARSLSAPLLFKGEDFRKTDIEPALAA